MWSDYKHENEKTVICPCCDYEFKSDDIWNGHLNNNINHEHEGTYQATCPECDSEFEVELAHVYRYSTQEIDE